MIHHLSLIPYDARCLELSWLWLNDPEIRELTMTPIFTREDQNIYFKNLPLRLDYKIWGILLDGHEIVGAAGLKNYRGSLAEYWGYIGEKKYWYQGLGQSLVKVVEEKARNSGIIDLDLILASEHVLQSSRLIVPHPRRLERRFVLDPLAELEPSGRDPTTGVLWTDAGAHLLEQTVERSFESW